MRAIKGVIACLLVAGCQEVTQVVFELPVGFRGWAHVAVDMPGCPPLEVRDGVTVFRIGPDGTACTSDGPRFGAQVVRYVYLDKQRTQLRASGWGGGGLVWADHGSAAVTYGGRFHWCSIGFFVGTEQELNGGQWDRPESERCSPRGYDASGK